MYCMYCMYDHVCMHGCMLSKYLRPYVSAGPVMGHRVLILLFYVVFFVESLGLGGPCPIYASIYPCIHGCMYLFIDASMHLCV